MKRILSLLLIIILIVPNFVLATPQLYLNQEKDADIEFFLEVYNYIKTTYPLEYNDRQIIEGGLKGMLNSLDPYSSYYDIGATIELYNKLSGSFSGIGICIEEKDGYINIIETIKDQPAEKAGLRKDDLIFKVDGKEILNMKKGEVSNLIQGPIGTKVKLDLRRGRKNFTVEIPRKNIEVPSVEYEILDNKIGYLQICQFQDTTLKDVELALVEFDENKIEKIIIDLRDNPGGLLYETIEVAREFIPEGPIVHIRQKNKKLITHRSNLEKQRYDLVVLVNENSASASEILAGAIKENKAGKLIGTKTYGKGIVQSIKPLTNGCAIKMTIAEYLLPNMKSIQGKGIKPDIIVENTTEDLQLKKAIELLKN